MGWRALAQNEVPAVDGLCAVIIGLTPSKGARSPLLWNAAFERLGIDGRMVAVDTDVVALPGLVAGLSADEQVIGGAVTMPHKVAVIPHLAGLSPVAESAGAVNCLLRGDGGFVGENTDGIAALRSVERKFGDISGARVLLIGTGGAGSAVAAALVTALGSDGSLVVANRDPASRDDLVGRLSTRSAAKITGAPVWPVIGAGLGVFDIIINATSLGFGQPVPHRDGWLAARFASPVAGVDDYPVMGREAAAAATGDALGAPFQAAVSATSAWLEEQRSSLVLDVIYQPERTLLLDLAERAGCRTLNGSWMNLEQAVIAFCAAVRAGTGTTVDPDVVRDAMLVAVEGTA